jgi:deoxyribodipyrimidine photolyase-related protein
MDIFVILPNQLFDKKYLPKNFKFYLWEHPQYFTKYKFNKKKLILHRASMKSYLNYLEKNNFHVQYFEFNQSPKLSKYSLFDPIDKIELKGKYSIFESPNFLLSIENYEEYRKKTEKFNFAPFFNFGKKIVDIIPDVKSQDKSNREKVPKNMEMPNIPKVSKNTYIKEAIKYVNKNFPKNYGNTDNFNYPISHSDARKWLKDFIDQRFKKFGPYEDFVMKEEPHLFHSVLSSSINIGLLNPLEIIDKIRNLKNKIPINSYEGYIRQLFWREYQRFCYIYFDFTSTDYFKNKNKLTKEWYDGTWCIDPVDDCIKKGFDSGYLHHIERLMVVGNFMNISQIDPWEGLKWFMEFSTDSYEWVMYQNVLDMVFCVSGGQTMKKPYISSSKYVQSMSDYKKGEWNDKWDTLYKKFMIKHRVKLLRDFKYFFHFIKNY